ncbi:S-layer homology domain-containing protein [Gordoniibacillus kamchatkensis]|uniref:S-layer homology domain-containing protein n=1 Tax=Gordoniibacillus kamchatkensis TaxID=1590651 RepID=UPI000696801A|nr:S-layer homology domain-containing protein [Paenibacillus sp. VKM B-2647]
MNKKIGVMLMFAILLCPLLAPARAGAASLTMTSISSSNGTLLALDSDGHIWAWGSNYSGEYGDGTTNQAYAPKRVDVTDNEASVAFQKVAAGFNSSLALDSSGHIWSTGNNGYGQLGNGTTTESHVWGKLAVQDSGTEVIFKDIAAERVNSLAIDNSGQLWVWGQGQSLVPMKDGVTNGVSFQSVDAMDQNAVALDASGYVWQIDNAGFNPQKLVATDSGGLPVRFKAISAGDTIPCGTWPCNYDLALDDAGNIWAWGSNTYGQLGNGTTLDGTNTLAKIAVTDSGSPVTFTKISAGVRYALALDSGGTLWSWGYNNNGQLGDGTQTDRYVPYKVVVTDNGNPVKFKTVRAGAGSSQAIDVNGQRWAWGGDLGDGTTGTALQPKKIQPGSATTLSVSAATITNLESLTLTATVTGGFGTPTGLVTFLDGGAVIGSGVLDASGTATFTVPALPAGMHNLTAQYSGNSSYNGSLSGAVNVQVNRPAAPALSIAQTPADLTSGTVILSVTAQTYGTGNSLDSLKWLEGDKSAADFLNAGDDITATGSFAVNRSGTYTVYAKDKAGNETVQTVAVDGIPAVWLTGVSLNGSSFTEQEGQNRLNVTGEANHIGAGDPLTLEFDIVDSQGTTVTHDVYGILSSGLHQAFSHSVTITSAKYPSGSYAMRVSVTAATYAPAVATLPFAVNTTLPTIRVTMTTADGKPYASGSWTNQNVTASVYASVYETSSLASLTLSVDGGDGQPVANDSSYTVSQEGKHTLVYQATDSAGHTFVQSVQVNIDRTPSGGDSGGDKDYGGGNTGAANPAAPPAEPAGPPTAPKPEPFKSFVHAERIIDMLKSAIASNRNATFSDTASHWAAGDIRLAARLGIADGYPGGAFMPDAPVTRAEFSKLIVQAFALSTGPKQVRFNDAGSHWAEGFIQTLASNGVIDGYEDGSFQPDNRISRAEMVAMLSRIADFAALQQGAAKTFADVTPFSWAKSVIEEAAGAGILQGVDNSRFAPDGTATRAEAVALILRTLRLNPAVSDMLDSIQS